MANLFSFARRAEMTAPSRAPPCWLFYTSKLAQKIHDYRFGDAVLDPNQSLHRKLDFRANETLAQSQPGMI
ncbi:protein of unknown function [Methylocella tundrae]|uniref:Uncharacterized protein n=1 Tax=Methylocella tundrae TaxID=227605 RepID=A0A4U8YUE3_METTU|nr:protein of unknown function [Methylocella tundrae]